MPGSDSPEMGQELGEAEIAQGPFISAISRQIHQWRHVYPDMAGVGTDFLFLCFLSECSHLGRFEYGPISIEFRVIEDLFERSYPRIPPGGAPVAYEESGHRFYRELSREVARSERRRIDELHWLLTFMRMNEGIPAKVFGELAVSPEEIERFSRGERRPASAIEGRERLFSPEDVADYLGVHVQTVRSWVRTGKLPARRLAGQRALRIRESDLERVLEAVEPESAKEEAT